MPTIGSRIRTRREELGLSQDELAKRLGYKSRSSLNKIELDQRNLTQSKIKAIADALETTPSYIMGWDETTDNLLLKTAREKVNGDRFFEKTLNEQDFLLSVSEEEMQLLVCYRSASIDDRALVELALRKYRENPAQSGRTTG